MEVCPEICRLRSAFCAVDRQEPGLLLQPDLLYSNVKLKAIHKTVENVLSQSSQKEYHDLVICGYTTLILVKQHYCEGKAIENDPLTGGLPQIGKHTLLSLITDDNLLKSFTKVLSLLPGKTQNDLTCDMVNHLGSDLDGLLAFSKYYVSEYLSPRSEVSLSAVKSLILHIVTIMEKDAVHHQSSFLFAVISQVVALVNPDKAVSLTGEETKLTPVAQKQVDHFYKTAQSRFLWLLGPKLYEEPLEESSNNFRDLLMGLSKIPKDCFEQLLQELASNSSDPKAHTHQTNVLENFVSLLQNNCYAESHVRELTNFIKTKLNQCKTQIQQNGIEWAIEIIDNRLNGYKTYLMQYLDSANLDHICNNQWLDCLERNNTLLDAGSCQSLILQYHRLISPTHPQSEITNRLAKLAKNSFSKLGLSEKNSIIKEIGPKFLDGSTCKTPEIAKAFNKLTANNKDRVMDEIVWFALVCPEETMETALKLAVAQSGQTTSIGEILNSLPAWCLLKGQHCSSRVLLEDSLNDMQWDVCNEENELSDKEFTNFKVLLKILVKSSSTSLDSIHFLELMIYGVGYEMAHRELELLAYLLSKTQISLPPDTLCAMLLVVVELQLYHYEDNVKKSSQICIETVQNTLIKSYKQEDIRRHVFWLYETFTHIDWKAYYILIELFMIHSLKIPTPEWVKLYINLGDEFMCYKGRLDANYQLRCFLDLFSYSDVFCNYYIENRRPLILDRELLVEATKCALHSWTIQEWKRLMNVFQPLLEVTKFTTQDDTCNGSWIERASTLLLDALRKPIYDNDDTGVNHALTCCGLAWQKFLKIAEEDSEASKSARERNISSILKTSKEAASLHPDNNTLLIVISNATKALNGYQT